MKPAAYYDATEKTFTLSAADAAKSRAKGNRVLNLYSQEDSIGRHPYTAAIWNKSTGSFCNLHVLNDRPTAYEMATHQITYLYHIIENNP